VCTTMTSYGNPQFLKKNSDKILQILKLFCIAFYVIK
jgi:hypothetical protein